MTAPNRPLRIACVGEAMIELSFRAPNLGAPRVAFAGDTLNMAVYLKRAIGDGAQVSYLTAMGQDPFSDAALAFMAGEGIETGHVLRDSVRLPGLYAITTDAVGERSFHYWREASAARAMFSGPEGLEMLAGFDIIALSAISIAILPEAARAALAARLADLRATGTRVVFDSNYRPRLWPSIEVARGWVERFWRLTDIGLPSIDDEQALFAETEEAATLARLRGYGLRAGALKRGARGPLALEPGVTGGVFPPAERVLDTTAAGDSFNGAFLAALLRGQETVAAMEAGHMQARAVVGLRGAFGDG